MNQNETVLCIKKALLPVSWVQEQSVVPLKLEDFETACSHAGFRFVTRPEAEKDPSFKQIIPYIILQTKDYRMTAIYNRQGSEQRLHDLWSIGIGGHINPVDRETQTDPFLQILTRGMERELNEELAQRPDKDHAAFIGVISEDITDVGKVHLGAVFRILTTTPEKYVPGAELSQFSWKKTRTLNRLPLELWSDLALRLLSTL